MKKYCIILVFVASACQETWDGYEYFIINKGSHTSSHKVELLERSDLSFQAVFDSSAIYKTVIEENQWDTNKLLGFSDCNSHHQEHSARFGWRWLDGKIEVIVYAYIDGARHIEKIGEAEIGEEHYYSIQLTKKSYVFRFGNSIVELDRAKKCEIGGYYMLFPYFGGDEVAPHDITIMIKRYY